jgi:RNA polymerase sigma factor (sigma-70 family)
MTTPVLGRSQEPMKDGNPPPPSSPEELFLANLPFIERLAAQVARDHRASADEAEEFASVLKMKLLEDDYAVFRKFQGLSKLKTYLTVVADRAFLDFRTRSWGRWRPSAEAIRQGEVAVMLEKLVSKEKWSVDEACEILRTNHKVTESRRQLQEIWNRLPVRNPPRMAGEDEIKDVVDLGKRPEEGVFEGELQDTRARVSKALDKVLSNLSLEDRLIIRMRILKGIKVVDIARTMCLKQKPLYRRIEQILERLRTDLEREEVRWDQVSDLLNWTGVGWGFAGRRSGKPSGTED